MIDGADVLSCAAPRAQGAGVGRGVTLEQRERILLAFVAVVAEGGYGRASVSAVVECAGVSRRTFYECFTGLEGCLAVVLDAGLEQTVRLIERVSSRQVGWEEAMRLVLAALLVGFDAEPALARVWFVESLAAGVGVLAHRVQNVELLVQRIVAGWPQAPVLQAPPLLAEGVAGSVFAIIHTHRLGMVAESKRARAWDSVCVRSYACSCAQAIAERQCNCSWLRMSSAGVIGVGGFAGGVGEYQRCS